MAIEEGLKKIIWAVDAFAEEAIQRQAIIALHALTAESSAVVEPVYILTPDQVNVSPNFFSEWAKTYRPFAERALRSLTGQSELKRVADPKVLVASHPSIRVAVDRLIGYAKERDADVIAATTHAKGGFSRLLMGSFAETLFLRSDIPVYVMNPLSKVGRKIASILFATDLGEESRRSFDSVLDLAAKTSAKLTLYCRVATQELLMPTMSPGAVPPPALDSLIQEEVEEKTKMVEKWAGIARKRGLMTQVVIDQTPGGVAASIVKLAESGNHSLIAMVAHTGPVASALMGSTTRQVVRTAPCPVMVLRKEV